MVKGLTDEEIHLLLKNLESGMKLPLLIDYRYTDRYTEQLVAEIYSNALLKGYTLDFDAWRSIRERGDDTCLKMNEKLLRTIRTMSGVVKRRVLDLKFERKFIDFLLLHDYEPEEDFNTITIGFRINGPNIKCFHIPRE